jgi:MFS family permease
MRASLRPVAAAFITFGFFGGAWAVATVDIEHSFGMTDAQLGALLGIGILAATIVAAFGGAITDRFGAAATLTRSFAIWGVLIAVEACAPRLGVFAPALILALSASGLVDVVMNVIAAAELSGEPGRLVRFHGLWNAGTVLGAAVTGVVIALGGSWRIAWFGVAIAAIVTSITSARARIPDPPPSAHPSMIKALLSVRHEGLFVVAVVFGAAAMVEGGIATWGVLYLRSHLGVGVLAGVSAYVVGQILATATRMGGGGIVGGLGTRRSIALGATLATGGLALEALSHNAVIAATGLAAATVGISVVWPLLMADVNNQARHPAIAIGGVTATGYLGMVVGPPLVGAVSSLFGLRVGLLVLAGVAAFVALTPARVRSRVPDLRG